MHQLTIIEGAFCMDGGSVVLRATDAVGRKADFSLDWSISATRAGATFLTVNGVKIEPNSAEERTWIERLQLAEIAAEDLPVPEPPPQNSSILAPDAKKYFDAMQKGDRSALSVLRDDMLAKLQTPLHKREVAPSTSEPSSRPKRLPLP